MKVRGLLCVTCDLVANQGVEILIMVDYGLRNQQEGTG